MPVRPEAPTEPTVIEPPTAPASPDFPRVDVLGVRFHVLTFDQTLRTLERFIHDRIPRQITFANAQTVALCRRNKSMTTIINDSDLVLADGMSIVWGSRLLGAYLPHRVAGPDVMNALSGLAASKGYKVFLMGSFPENLERLKEALLRSWPGLQIVGIHSPPMCDKIGPEETDVIIEKLRATSPDILFVGVSFPKQELWINENKLRLNVPVMLAVGAAFDFLSGRIPRAPEWLRKRGGEWIHRLWCEPRRLWRRYLLGNSVFFAMLIYRRIRRRLSS